MAASPYHAQGSPKAKSPNTVWTIQEAKKVQTVSGQLVKQKIERFEGMSTGWRKVKLASVAELNPRSFDEPLNNDDLVSFVPMKLVEEESGRMSPSETKSWGEVRKGYTPFQNGDVIFAKITPCMENGKYALARGLHGGRAAGSTEFHVFRPSPDLDAQYLLNFLFSHDVRRAARMNMRGAAGQLRVPTTFFEELEIPLPSVSEQRRIVAEIEKQFTRLEAGVAALRRVQANLKRYRAAVLKAACEGKLVENEVALAKREGRSVETAEELLQRILAERRKKWNGRGKYREPGSPNTPDLPSLQDGWTWLTIETFGFVTKLAGFEYTKFVKYSPDGDLAVIKAENAGRSGFKRTDFSRVESNTVAQLTRSQLKSGDLLMVFVGAGTGNVARVPDDQPYFLGPNIGMIRVESRDISAAYVELFLRSPLGNSLALGFAKAVAQPSLSMGTIRMIPVAIPPLSEQKRIVAEVERRLSVVEELEGAVGANLRRAGRLRQAILQRAFSGELVGVEIGEAARQEAGVLGREKDSGYQAARREPRPTERKRPNRHFARALLSAEIVDQLHGENTFGRVKHQKIFHLCEHIAGIEEIEGRYHREAAGPLDNKLIYSNEGELKKQKWYRAVEREEIGHEYVPMERGGGHRKYVDEYWAEKLPVIRRIIELMRGWKTDACEIFSTTYAAWNDLLLWGKEPTEENILREILERWHEKKKSIPRERWVKAIAWMKKEGLEPTGFGKATREAG